MLDEVMAVLVVSMSTIMGAVIHTVVAKPKDMVVNLKESIERLEVDLSEERGLRKIAEAKIEVERAGRHESEERRIARCAECVDNRESECTVPEHAAR